MILRSALLGWFEWSRTLATKVLVGGATGLEPWKWISPRGGGGGGDWAAGIIHVRCALNFWDHDGVQIRCSQLFHQLVSSNGLVNLGPGKRYVPYQ